jgi:phosphoserine phosphatase
MIPPYMLASLEQLDKRTCIMHDGPRIAVFDLDNTLLVGDIGEAVYAQLLSEDVPLGMDWDEYLALRDLNPVDAWRYLVSSMEGTSVRRVEEATHVVLNSRYKYIPVDHHYLPVPRVHPIMKDVVDWLHAHRFDTYVISASNHISVSIVARTCFGIAAEHAFGIRSWLRNERLTESLLKPVPTHRGKVEVYQANIGPDLPLLTAGDSPYDVPMLSLTLPQGLSLWVSDSPSHAASVKARHQLPQRFCFVLAENSAKFKKHLAYV